MEAQILDTIKSEITKTIGAVVNGKIDDIKQHLIKQDEELGKLNSKIDDLTEKTLPVVESITMIKLIKKFVVWAAPLGALAGLLKWIR